MTTTKLYCSVTEARVFVNNLPKVNLLPGSGTAESRTYDLLIELLANRVVAPKTEPLATVGQNVHVIHTVV